MRLSAAWLMAASQEINGSGSNTYANTDGDIGSNADITMDQNTAVYGSAIPGPSSAVFLNGQSTVSGATLPAPEPFPLPPLDILVIPSSGRSCSMTSSWPPTRS